MISNLTALLQPNRPLLQYLVRMKAEERARSYDPFLRKFSALVIFSDFLHADFCFAPVKALRPVQNGFRVLPLVGVNGNITTTASGSGSASASGSGATSVGAGSAGAEVLRLSKSTTRTLIVSFQGLIAYIHASRLYHSGNTRDKRKALCQSADAVDVDGNVDGSYEFACEIPNPTIPSANQQPLDMLQVAAECDAIDKCKSTPEIVPYFVRPGVRQLLLQCQEIGYEMVLLSDRSEHKTNVALHPIDPDLKIFPQSHRLY